MMAWRWILEAISALLVTFAKDMGHQRHEKLSLRPCFLLGGAKDVLVLP